MTDTVDIIKGRIEAFEFLAGQLATYANDNDEIQVRYGDKSKKAIAVSAMRSATFRELAKDCTDYAAAQRAGLPEADDYA